MAIKNRTGELITSETYVKQILTEYFRNLLAEEIRHAKQLNES